MPLRYCRDGGVWLVLRPPDWGLLGVRARIESLWEAQHPPELTGYRVFEAGREGVNE